MIKNILKSKKEITGALIERGEKQLFRLGVIIDVLYALMIYKLFTLMPNPDIDGVYDKFPYSLFFVIELHKLHEFSPAFGR